MATATNRTERAVKGTLVSFLQFGTQMMLQAFLAPMVLRLAGQETLGSYALLMQVVGYLAMLDLGFSVSLSRYLGHASGTEDGGNRYGAVFVTARTFLLGSNAVIAALTLVLAFQLDALFTLTPLNSAQARLGLCIVALWTLVRAPLSVYGIALNATQDLAAANFIGIVGNAGRLLFSLGLVYAGAGLAGLICANVLAEAASMVLCFRRFRRLFPGHRSGWGIPDQGLFREMVSFSLQALLVNVAWRLVYYTDNIVVGYLYGAAAVSVYYTTQMPTTVGFNIANKIADNAAPALNELHALGDWDKVREVFLRLHRITFLVALLLVAGILLLNESLVTLWVGPAQYAGYSMTAALAAFAFLITLTHVNGSFLFASGNIRAFGRIAVAEGVANLVLSLVMGKFFGLAGVMWATVLANFPATAVLLFIALRRLQIGWPEYLRAALCPSLFPFAAGCLVCSLVARFSPVRGWLGLITEAGVLSAVYVGTAYRWNLTEPERHWLETRVLGPFRSHGFFKRYRTN
jgi:O-antigen/teichoic acid export membrane protein